MWKLRRKSDAKTDSAKNPRKEIWFVMEQQLVSGMAPSMRKTGWLAVSSAVVGLVAIVFLIAAVTARSTWSISSHVYLLFRAHDIGVVLQFILLIPLALGLQKLSRRNHPGISNGSIAWGVGAICLVALLLLLGVGKVVNDMFYMLPQGVFGAWLIFVSVRLSSLLPRWLRVFGMIVGFGLLLVGTVFPGLAAFVYPNMLKIPAVPVDDEAFQNTEINRVLHLILAVGSLLGVVTLPLWTFLMGLKLLKREYPASQIASKL